MSKFIVNVVGPDDIIEFDSKEEAFEYANGINQSSAIFNANRDFERQVWAIALVFDSMDDYRKHLELYR